MKPPGFLRATALVAAKDLRLELRTWETLGSSLIFSLIVLVIFNFAFGLDAVREFGAQRLVPGVVWLVLAFAAVVGMARSMQLEVQHDTLTALFLAPVDRGTLYLGKLAANLVKFTALQWIVLPLSAVFLNYDLLGIVGPLLLVLFLHGLALAEMGTLFAAVVTRVGRGEALLATLVFPAVSPVLISATKCTSALIAGDSLQSVWRWMAITATFDVLYLLVSWVVFEYVLEE
ncbi:MAG: hypothetical protein GY716_13795 [bacterium]|nr:hypothetical protein [bacterium]